MAIVAVGKGWGNGFGWDVAKYVVVETETLCFRQGLERKL
jgi:hypothetical protein